MRLLTQIAARAALVAFGISLALVTAEICLRLLGLSYPTMTTFLSQDYHTGWAHKPGISFPNPLEGRRTRIIFNSFGMRDDREYQIKKSPGVFRIAVLGDSFTEALQVAQKDDFVSIAELELSSCKALQGRKPQLLNFGVFGYGTAQELIQLRQRVVQWSPDLVVLQFYTNDLADNNPATARGSQSHSWAWGPRPYSLLRNGVLVEDDAFRTSGMVKDNIALQDWNHTRFHWLYALIINSRVRQLLHYLRRNAVIRPFFHIELWIEKEVFSVPQVPLPPKLSLDRGPMLEAAFRREAPLLREPQEEVWTRSWRLTEALLTETARESAAHGARFLLLVATDPLQVYPDKDLRQKFLPDPFYLNRRLETLAEKKGFDILNLAEPLQAYVDQRHAYLHGFDDLTGWGHYNETGHRLVGHLLAQKICDGLK
jgi:lysophospholipase L1-like esterase